VRLNGGRPGARDGPTALRAALVRYGVSEPHGWNWPRIFDAGDIVPAEGEDSAALEETHRRVTEATAALLDLGLFPIGIGGGHDLTFPFVRAVAQRQGGSKLAGVYFDAHLDVRDELGSGMAFRKLIEECGVGPLTVYGLDGFANSRQHWEWFEAHGGQVGQDYPEEEQFHTGQPMFVSLDLDVLDASQAPGVSSVNPAGWMSWELAESVFAAGFSPDVKCLDIMELCPPFDIDGRTARTAVHLLLEFLRGLALRPLLSELHE
jgi:formiminoglutamase